MNDAQCLAIRDQISACTFPPDQYENIHRRFRLVAVTAGGADGADATVHVEFPAGRWALLGAQETPEEFLETLFNTGPYSAMKLSIERSQHWILPWSITAVDPASDMPVLILRERADLVVEGVLMREPVHGSHAELANRYPEEDAVCALLTELASMGQHDSFLRWYKEANIAACSLDTACVQAPESPQGQKFVIVYRGGEWWFGIWNNPAKIHWAQGKELSLSSIADFHGSRVSKAKLARRSGIELVRGRETVRGDSAVLAHALAEARRVQREGVGFAVGEFESHPGVRVLCDWWNSVAPEALRTAASFRIYSWSESRRVFLAGDPEEPTMDAEVLANAGPFALFEKEGSPQIAVAFYRGREYNIARNGSSVVFGVSGEEVYDVGLALEDMDEAYSSARGLEAAYIQAF
ncbi:hypothetical protein [Acidovorax sp. sic0104]|uniref:hypothetical protein n=1 Tax=Acidovorax sp. sic0104 TaxID=2854784 RepID=UPI001C4526FA|nr:hypothetical protein [Acidovorax sp. sic0104]MBV7541999.1 hypothetical protein [Acidovorax sp. sic0104]